MTMRVLRGGPGAQALAEVEVRRSRFLARLTRVGSEPEARAAIAESRRVFPDARHHCTAFVIGAEEAGRIRRSSDDGEPAGTAGAPMLEALGAVSLIDCVAVVSRYFGGVLLGTGGLARAYADAVAAAIQSARERPGIVDRVRRERFVLELDHAEAGQVEAALRERGVMILGASYAATATLSLTGDRPWLEGLVAAVTAGRGRLVAAGAEWVDVAG